MSRHNGVPHPADEQPGPEDVELAQALESYLAAVEAGRPPDPEQLLAEARHGGREALGRLLELYRNYLALLARTQIDLHVMSPWLKREFH